MKIKTKKFIFFSVFLCSFLIVVSGYEIYLRKKYGTPKIKTGYSIETYNHRGQKISIQNGALKLCLAPHTIYKNLPNQHTQTFTINSHGFRGKELKQTPDKLRIIFVGGSACFGQGADEDTETLPAILAEMNDNIEVINTGVVGFLSGQEYAYLATELIDLKPHMVIAYDGWNDLYEAWSYEYHFNRQKYPDEFSYSCFVMNQIEKELMDNYTSKTVIGNGFKRFLFSIFYNSYIIKAMYMRMPYKVKMQNYDFVKEQKSLNQPIDKYLDGICKSYTENIMKMNNLCRHNNIDFLVVIQPECGQKKNLHSNENLSEPAFCFEVPHYKDEFPQCYRDFVVKSTKKFKQADVAYININEQPQLIDSPEQLFLDAVHTNYDGNKIIAQIVYEKINPILKNRKK